MREFRLSLCLFFLFITFSVSAQDTTLEAETRELDFVIPLIDPRTYDDGQNSDL